jgi:hypothetical protein
VQVFARYEDETYALLQKLIAGASAVPREVFDLFLSKIFKRKL